MVPVSIRLLFDPDCGLCVATAGWLARRAPSDRLRLVPLTEVDADPELGAIVGELPLRTSLHAVRLDGSIVTGGRAAIAALRAVPRWRYLAAAVDHDVSYLVLEPLYRLVAARRRRIGRALGLPADCDQPGQAPASRSSRSSGIR
jgi:predicted DCC family thiol-disulfide oxidoreductase YuxK